jgi:hypothetical protein
MIMYARHASLGSKQLAGSKCVIMVVNGTAQFSLSLGFEPNLDICF